MADPTLQYAIQVPIQPFDDRLRTDIRLAIVRAFERTFKDHGCDYDPDTCGEAADEVIALLVSRLLGVQVERLPSKVVGNGTLVIDPNRAPKGGDHG